MNQPLSPLPLLPLGLRDLLPPEAAAQSHCMQQLLERVALFGYQQVMPPLAEFENTMSAHPAHMAQHSLRVMDPLSSNMLVIRPDFTTQMERIASTRLHHAPLPLRLSYSGNVLRAKPEGLSHERQMAQAGIELIGSASHHADAEVILVLQEALAIILPNEPLVADISIAGLLDALIKQEHPATQDAIRAAVAHKDASALPACHYHTTLATLLELGVDDTTRLQQLASLPMPDAARALCTPLEPLLHSLKPYIPCTLDPLAHGGLSYHEGICFSLFLANKQVEAARGGRYQIQQPTRTLAATGGTVYVQRLLSFLPALPVAPSQHVQGFTPEHRALRDEGIITIHALDI